MRRCSWSFGMFLLIALVAAPFLGDEATGADQSSTSARNVSIPVTVTKKSGEYASGLSASDFFVSVGGHNLLLQSLQEIPPLLVGTNRIQVPFIIFDALGAPNQDEVRKECLQFLADSVVEGLPISLSEIDSDGLHEIHGVATPHGVLAAALLQLDEEKHFLQHRDQLETSAKTSEDKSQISSETENLRRFRRGSVQGLNMMGTVQAQLNALRQMAVALQHVKGRKTALWLTGYFPLEVNEVEDSLNINSWGVTSSFPVQKASIEYQKTIDLLNDAQISVFPLDVESGHASSNLPAPVAGDRTTTGLRMVAGSTGGEEMVFTQGLDSLVRRALDKSKNYYQLTFQTQADTHLRWKTLKVEVNDKSLQTKFPGGLFIFPAK